MIKLIEECGRIEKYIGGPKDSDSQGLGNFLPFPLKTSEKTLSIEECLARLHNVAVNLNFFLHWLDIFPKSLPPFGTTADIRFIIPSMFVFVHLLTCILRGRKRL